MKIVCEVYGCLCELSNFVINDTEADYNDFGRKYDEDSENAEEYACGNMIFESKSATKEVLDKYKINLDEYNVICEKLEKALSFGCCGWCV